MSKRSGSRLQARNVLVAIDRHAENSEEEGMEAGTGFEPISAALQAAA